MEEQPNQKSLNGRIKAEEQEKKKKEKSQRHYETDAIGGSQKAVLQKPKAWLLMFET